jgi:hypothetical protein
MTERHIRLKPPLVVRGHYQRYAWTVRSLIALYPRLFFPVVGLKARERSWMIQDETRLVIEGFPRSANNFALTAFLFAQADMVNVSHHMHAPAQMLTAARKNLPTLVLVRKPSDAVLSWVGRFPHQSLAQALKYYVRYYKAILPLSDKYVLATFEEVTCDFGKVIDNINRKFCTSFHLFSHTEENQEKCFRRIRKNNSPSADRNRVKMSHKDTLSSDKYKSLILEAEKIYAEVLTLTRQTHSGD